MVEKFLDASAEIGVDGYILPDLPLDEYEAEYQATFKERDLGITFLVTPQTSDERVKLVDRLSTDFVYAVSTPSITGGKLDIGQKEDAYYERLESLKLATPVLIGFGISDAETFARSTQRFSGGIIGTAFLRSLAKGDNPTAAAKSFISSIRENDS